MFRGIIDSVGLSLGLFVRICEKWYCQVSSPYIEGILRMR